MAILAFGNRLLWMGRSSSNIAMTSTAGSPALFNTAVVSEGVSVPPRGLGGIMSAGYSHPSAAPTMWFHFDAARGAGSSLTPGNAYLDLVDTTGASVFFMGQAATVIDAWSRNSSDTLVKRVDGIAPIADALTSYDIAFTSGASGGVAVYRNGVLWFQGTWGNGGSRQPAGIRLYNWASGSNSAHATVFSQLAVSDGDDLRGFLVPSRVVTGTGTYNDGAGAPVDTADLNLATAKTLAAAGQKWTGTKAAFSLPSGSSLDLVAVNMLARTGGAVPNGRILARRAGVDGTTSNLSPALGGGYTQRSVVLATDPITGLPWSSADFDAAEFGLEARA